MGKISLVVRRKDCMGCHACEVACKQEHGLDSGPRLIRVLEHPPQFQPVYCHHCTKAPCLETCPEGAIFRTNRGIVLIDDERCIGCKTCMDACPFGAMQFHDGRQVAVKCDLCHARLERNEEPACTRACPTACVFWGDAKAFTERIDGSII